MNLFGNFGALAKLMGQLPRLQEEAKRMSERLEQIVAEGDAGAGMVKVRANGRMVVLSCTLSPEAPLNDREMLEDLIKAATNQALDKARQMQAEEMSKLAGSLGLPPGFTLPGMG